MAKYIIVVGENYVRDTHMTIVNLSPAGLTLKAQFFLELLKQILNRKPLNNMSRKATRGEIGIPAH